MGGHDVETGTAILNRANIPAFGYPDTAARMFSYMWRYAYNLKSLYETPSTPDETEAEAPDRRRAEGIIDSVRSSGRTLLTEFESKQVLEAYGIPTVTTRIARSEDEAIAEAGQIGYPVVLKVYSETITHKTDVGGVQLNLADGEEVRRAYRAIQQAVSARLGAQQGEKDFLGVAVEPMVSLGGGYEIILGSSIDSQFGPVLLFGSGGQLVEVFKDRSLALPPLNTTLARRMMEQTRIYAALKGVRGRRPVDLAALERLLVRFSQLVVEQRWIKELDINPLMVSPEGSIALDARVLLHGLEVTREQLPRLAIRPYPMRYVQPWKAADGSEILIRPIRPEDEPLMVKFHEGLSDRSVYLRYLHPMMLSQRVTHERLARICFINYERELVLVAERTNGKNGREIVAAARVDRLHNTDEGQVSVLITDGFQGKGLGRELMRRLVQIARDEKMKRLFAVFTADNRGMKEIMQGLGFRIGDDKVQGRLRAQMDL
jgi:acetyltransferase